MRTFLRSFSGSDSTFAISESKRAFLKNAMRYAAKTSAKPTIPSGDLTSSGKDDRRLIKNWPTVALRRDYPERWNFTLSRQPCGDLSESSCQGSKDPACLAGRFAQLMEIMAVPDMAAHVSGSREIRPELAFL
jgi:hypothetical protein